MAGIQLEPISIQGKRDALEELLAAKQAERAPIVLPETLITPTQLPEMTITAGEPEAAPPATQLPETTLTAGEPEPDQVSVQAGDLIEPYSDVLARGDKPSYTRTDLNDEETAKSRRQEHLLAMLAERQQPERLPSREEEYIKLMGRRRGPGAAVLSDMGMQLYQNRDRDYVQGLLAAREADRAERMGDRPVDPATLALIARQVDLPIETLKDLRQNSPIMKLLGQGGLTAQTKERGQTLNFRSGEDDNNTKRDLAGDRNALEREKMAQQLEIARMKLPKFGKGSGGGHGDGMVDMEASYLKRSVQPTIKEPLTLEQAKAYLEGTLDVSGMSEAAQEALAQGKAEIRGMKTGKHQDYLKFLAKPAGARIDVSTANLRKQTDPKEVYKIKGQLGMAGSRIRRAQQAFTSMSDTERRALAMVASMGGQPSTIANATQKYALDEAGQAKVSDIVHLINGMLRDVSGAAVTENEFSRFAQAAGLAGMDWDLFNSPNTLGHFLDRAWSEWKIANSNFRSTYPEQFKE